MLRIRQFQAVDRQKNQHGVGADPLVAVYERMVFHQTVTESGGLLLERGKGAGVAEDLKGCVKGRIQKSLVPQPRTAAGLIYQVLMEQQDFPEEERAQMIELGIKAIMGEDLEA